MIIKSAEYGSPHRHGRTCSGHPHLWLWLGREVVDTRDKRWHDEQKRHCEEPTGPARSDPPDDKLHDEAIRAAASELDCFAPLAMTETNKKAPRGNREAFVFLIVKEAVPFLADLAATYSSKP